MTLWFFLLGTKHLNRFNLQDDWLRSIEETCQFFGAVPQEILFDHAKTTMIERVRLMILSRNNKCGPFQPQKCSSLAKHD